MSQDVASRLSLLSAIAISLVIAFGASQSSRAASVPPYERFVGPAVEHPSPALRSGPAVWHQEYWDVKPERFDEFVATYKRDFYSLVRKVPGYRGYLMITTLPRTGETAQPARRIHEPIYPHGHILLEGTIPCTISSTISIPDAAMRRSISSEITGTWRATGRSRAASRSTCHELALEARISLRQPDSM